MPYLAYGRVGGAPEDLKKMGSILEFLAGGNSVGLDAEDSKDSYKGHSYNSIGSIDGTSLGPIFFPTSLACFCSAVDTQSRKRFTINRSSRTSWSGLEIKIIRYAEF